MLACENREEESANLLSSPGGTYPNIERNYDFGELDNDREKEKGAERDVTRIKTSRQ